MHLYSFYSRNTGFVGCKDAEEPEGSRRAETFPLDVTLFGSTGPLITQRTNPHVHVYAHVCKHTFSFLHLIESRENPTHPCPGRVRNRGRKS